MWLLISERGELFLITPKIEHLVSRKGGSITLSDDQSISRQHARILLENEDQNDDDSGIVLVDMSSKYCTFINSGIESNTKIETNQRIILKHDDLVRFGLQWNIWR
ncbi:uncharacterized protein LOC142329088 [Lycorma delicatula]|uniref:uncharacterized protein LOC142329088 n=1 Tax=Lycorma delicatula TaxID=130591 RepID=UPI003F50D567